MVKPHAMRKKLELAVDRFAGTEVQIPNVPTHFLNTQATMDPREGWRDGSDTEISSCDEYVYKKYWEVSLFEDAIASMGNDYRAMYNHAFDEQAEYGNIGVRSQAGAHCEDSSTESTSDTSRVVNLKHISWVVPKRYA